MSSTTLDTTVQPAFVLTEEEVDATLRRLDFSITGPRPDTYRMDTIACSCSSSCSRPRQPK